MGAGTWTAVLFESSQFSQQSSHFSSLYCSIFNKSVPLLHTELSNWYWVITWQDTLRTVFCTRKKPSEEMVFTMKHCHWLVYLLSLCSAVKREAFTLTVDVKKLLPWILGTGDPVPWGTWEATGSLLVGLPDKQDRVKSYGTTKSSLRNVILKSFSTTLPYFWLLFISKG